MATVSIEGLRKTAVLAALHNNAKVFGAGSYQAVKGDLSEDDVRSFLDSGDDRTRMFQSDDRSSLDFQYFRGRLLYVNLEGAAIESYAFDQQSGEGACGKVIAHLRKTGSVERILPGVAWDGSAL